MQPEEQLSAIDKTGRTARPAVNIRKVRGEVGDDVQTQIVWGGIARKLNPAKNVEQTAGLGPRLRGLRGGLGLDSVDTSMQATERELQGRGVDHHKRVGVIFCKQGYAYTRVVVLCALRFLGSCARCRCLLFHGGEGITLPRLTPIIVFSTLRILPVFIFYSLK